MNVEVGVSVPQYFSGIQFLVATEGCGTAECTGLAPLKRVN